MNLIPWLAGAFTGVTGFFATWLSAKAAIAAAALTVLGALWLAFALSISGAVTALAVSLPAWAAGGLIFIPTNVPTCLAALFTAKIARMVFEYQREMIRVISYIT